MPIIQVEVIETLARIIEVDTEDESDAVCQVMNMYRKCDVVLDHNDFIHVDFKIFKSDE
ncbi:MAG: DpnD/PcfM family protein [Moraxella sp.]|nr:DpnD/PcfM family protein [Moraxella sp.]